MSTSDDVTVRLRLQDVARFIADVKTGKLSIEGLEKEIQKAGKTAQEASHPRSGGFGMITGSIRQMRYAAMGVGGILASAGVASAGFAVKATANFEQVQMAFRTMLGDKAADAMLSRLQTFAAKTPFEFKDLAKASQQMLAFGFSARSVIPTMTSIGDAMSAVGGGSAGVDRVLMALGQMKMKGRVQGDELLQLAENNIDAVGYLSKALGLTEPQVLKAASQGKIAASKAIPVILSGMEAQYPGMMAKQARTLSGIWSNMVDSVTQGAIRVTTPFLPAIKKWLKDLVDRMPEIEAWLTRWINKTIDGAQKGVKSVKVGIQWVRTMATRLRYDPQALGRDAGEEAGGGIRSLFGAANGKKQDWYKVGETVGQHAVGFVWGFAAGLFDPKAWGPVIRDHWLAMLLTVISFVPVGRLLGLLGKGLGSVPILRALTPVLERAGGLLERAGGPVWKMVGGFARAVGRALWASLVRVFPEAAFELEYRLLRLGEIFTRSIPGVARRAAAWARRAVSALVGSLLDATLYAAKDVAGSLDILFLKPLRAVGRSIASIARYIWDPFKVAFKDSVNWIISRWNGINFTLPGGKSIGVPKIPFLAAGGTITAGGLAMVGERGPEVVSLPPAASVIPLPRLGEMTGRPMPPIHTHIYLNGREIAQAVTGANDDRLARL